MFVVTFVAGVVVVMFEVAALVEVVMLVDVVLVEVWSILLTTGVNSRQAKDTQVIDSHWASRLQASPIAF